MAKKGEKKHLKRINAPKVRRVSRKKEKWAVSSSPGPHSGRSSLPLSVSIRGNLGIVRNEKEAEKILGKGEVEVDGKLRKDPKYPVGLMDVVEIPKMGKSWRVLFDRKGYLCFNEIEGDETGFKLEKVVGKVPFEGERIQLSLGDGKTIIGGFSSVKLGDTVKVSLPNLSFESQIPLEKGNIAFITGGRNVGRKGEIKEILEVSGPSSDQIVIEADGEEFQSPEEYVFVIGEDSPEITLMEGC